MRGRKADVIGGRSSMHGRKADVIGSRSSMHRRKADVIESRSSMHRRIHLFDTLTPPSYDLFTCLPGNLKQTMSDLNVSF